MTDIKTISKNHSDVLQNLTQLGFSPIDARVYLDILQYENTNAGAVIKRTGLHREQTYRSLKKMRDYGYITETKNKSKKTFTASDPNVFIYKTKSQMELAQGILPVLMEIQNNNSNIVKVLYGKHAYKTLFDDVISTIPQGHELRLITSMWGDFYDIAKDYQPEYTKNLRKKQAKTRAVFHCTDETEIPYFNENFLSLRFIPQINNPPISTLIYSNKVAIEILDKNNPAIIIIENPYIAHHYRQNFEGLWNKAIVPSGHAVDYTISYH